MDVSTLPKKFIPFLDLGKAIFDGIYEFQKSKSMNNLTIQILKLLNEQPESFGNILMIGFLQNCDDNLKNVNKVQKDLVRFLEMFNEVVEKQKHLINKSVIPEWDAKRKAIIDAAQYICSCDISSLQECRDAISSKKIKRPLKVYNDIKEIPRMWLYQKKVLYCKDIKLLGEENTFDFVRYLKKGFLGKWREFEECHEYDENETDEMCDNEEGNLELKNELKKRGLSPKDLKDIGIS